MQQNQMGILRHLTSIYLMKKDQVLLLYRIGSRVVNHMWVSSAGGHFEQEELNDAKSCALRELKEELNVDESMLSDLKMRYVTLYRNEKELRQNYYFFAELNDSAPVDLISNEGTLKWVHLNDLKELEMPFTSRKVMDHFVQTGRFDSKLYAGISSDKEMQFLELTLF